jgi:hypothetical protein
MVGQPPNGLREYIWIAEAPDLPAPLQKRVTDPILVSVEKGGPDVVSPVQLLLAG